MQFPEAAKRGLYSAAIRIAQDLQTNEKLPVDRGTYKGGWRAERTPDGADVYNVAPHAIFIEHGVRAANVKIGRAMLDALAEWARRKGIGNAERTTKSGKTRVVRPGPEQMRKIAWAIAMAIKKRGLWQPAGLQPLERALQRGTQYVREEVQREVAKVVGLK